MEYFAHNGVNHGSAAEAVGHSLPQIILIVLLVSVGTVAFMALMLYLANRLSVVTIPINEDNKED